MKIRVPLGIVTAVMMILAVMVLPVSAVTTPQDVETTANIATGGGNVPIVLCKWEADTTASWEDGDPTHALPGSQFLPPVTYEAKKPIQYFAVVFDHEDNGNVNVVAWDVYHPQDDWVPAEYRESGPLGDGFKYQVMGTKITNKTASVALFQRAMNAGLLTIDEDFNATTILTQYLEKGTAALWVGTADIDYQQPAGNYRVEANAIDFNNNWAVPLENTFLYVPVAAFELDFNTVNYGSVNINTHKWVAGDVDFGTADWPTIRNIGNTHLQVTVQQDDMGLGESLSGWNVQWDARLGNDDANTKVYKPFEAVTLPNPLELCDIDELDFSIQVFKGTTGEKTGTMTLGAVVADGIPT
ncbi:conserved exported protein of unknown function [Methanoculleus bourgensis]|jgi:hypothetical protein|uniref:Uncharacterized protein n=2 Tax=Methanoculleus bourgensis TaxID=83986 RepID=A0A0X3BIC1_9EURY|nr:conserved exported protein of unknown function [Methanoculleus bourgensis]